MYKGQKENKQKVLKIVSYKDINNKIQYKVKWIGYNKTIWELLKKPKECYKKGIGALEEKGLGNIKELKVNRLVKGNR